MPIEDPQGHEITRTSPAGKPVKRKATPRQSEKAATDNALGSIVRDANEQVSRYQGDVREAIQGYAEHQADEFVSAVQEMPTMFFESVNRKLQEVEVDRDSFREASESLKAIFAVPSRES